MVKIYSLSIISYPCLLLVCLYVFDVGVCMEVYLKKKILFMAVNHNIKDFAELPSVSSTNSTTTSFLVPDFGFR